MDYKLLWNKILRVFPLLKESYTDDSCTENDYREAVEIINSLKLSAHIESLTFSNIEKAVRQNAVPRFWSHFTETSGELSHFTQFQTAVEDLYEDMSVYVPVLNKLNQLRVDCGSSYAMYGETNIFSSFKVLVRATLLAQIPVNYTKVTESFYEVAFRAFCNVDDEMNNADLQCNGCLRSSNLCRCEEICHVFYDTNRRLVELELLEPLVGQVLTSLMHVRIKNYISQKCKGSFDVSYIKPLEKVCLNEEAKAADVFLSLPCIIGSAGVTHIVRQVYSQNEKEKLQKSTTKLHELIVQLNL